MAAGGLLSSPVQMAHHDSVITISSSPEFPSICDLVPKATKKPSLRTGSNAAPLPPNAPTAFTSAASIWRLSSVPTIQDNEGPDTLCFPKAIPTMELPPESAIENAKHGRQGVRGKQTAPGTIRKKTGQNESSGATEEPVMVVAAAEVQVKKPARKARATKDPALAQTTLSKGKVTKPAAKEAKTRKKAETVSRHFARPVAPESVRESPADPIEDETVILEPAMRRRMDWTPPRESTPMPHPADSSMIKELSSSTVHTHRDVFRTLQDTYGRTEDASCLGDDAATSAAVDVLGKRKLIEMVVAMGNKQKTPEPSPTKPKVVKKKARTITELATAAYRQSEEHSVAAEQPKRDSLLGYLGTSSEQSTAASKGGKAKGPKKPTKPKAAKKEPVRKHLLLSPTSAMRQVAKQDFVFGTASQLATEDDPALLRALHEAMKASNQPDSDPFASPNPVSSNLAIRKRAGPGLWAAGARDDDGDLLNQEVLDLTRSSPLGLDHLPRLPCGSQKSAGPATPVEKACIAMELSDDTLDANNTPSFQRTQPLPTPLGQPRISLNDFGLCHYDQDQPPTPVNEAEFEPPPSNQEQHQLLLSQSNSPQQAQPELLPRPNFELYTDARLAKEVTSYGFKVVKKRAAMIAILEQCWKSQNQANLGRRTARASMSTSSARPAVSPLQPRGRPRKISATPSTDSAEAPGPGRRGRKKSVSPTESEVEGPQPEKRTRGRPKKDTAAASTSKSKTKTSAASPKRAAKPRTQPTSPAPTTPKRRKAPTKSVVEIPDPNSGIDPFASLCSSASPTKSPLPSSDDIFSSPPPMDFSITDETETSLLTSPTTQQVSLFRYITQAVVTAPRSTDPANPSWHEKMLMYDPIILEDLTAWLNAGQLDRVGYDAEVAPGDVKKWCESRSVCCLWRVGVNGRERKRF
ncbi:hypothetical protein VTI74DRAFT_5307 [Chaetomium olivicolor]